MANELLRRTLGRLGASSASRQTQVPGPEGEAAEIIATDLPTRQRQLARERHPGDYVVLLEDRIVQHSPDRQEALRAYREAAASSATVRPVIVSPDARSKRSPILRGRSLKRARTA